MDLAIVCPATANVMNKLAAGVADDFLTTLFLAWDQKKPWLVAPAMNRNMWAHPATRRSAKTLAEGGVRLLGPAKGRQACGDIGEGRLLEPEEIYLELRKHL